MEKQHEKPAACDVRKVVIEPDPGVEITDQITDQIRDQITDPITDQIRELRD